MNRPLSVGVPKNRTLYHAASTVPPTTFRSGRLAIPGTNPTAIFSSGATVNLRFSVRSAVNRPSATSRIRTVSPSRVASG